eukprot:SAG31_NODE_325_length_17671_cov_9.902743_19_plen_46_part_00
MGLFALNLALNLPYARTEKSTARYSLVLMGLFALNLPCAHRETRD